MTKTQLKHILGTFGYSFGMMTKLDGIQTISTCFDSNQYPGPSTRFKFLDDHDLLLVYYGHEGKDGDFIARRNDQKGNPVPDFYISYDSIYAITAVTPLNISEPYRLGKEL